MKLGNVMVTQTLPRFGVKIGDWMDRFGPVSAGISVIVCEARIPSDGESWAIGLFDGFA